VERHPVLEARAEKRVHVRMRRTAHAAVVMAREDALRASKASAERLVDRVAHDPLSLRPAESCEALSRRVVDRHDEGGSTSAS
jgi:hypothetical protein